MSCHWQNEDFIDHVRRRVECWQPGTPHRRLTRQRLMHEAGDLGTRLVGEQTAGATDLAQAWCGRVFWHQWQVVLQRFARTGPSGEVWQTRRTEVNYNSPAELIWTHGLVSWRLLLTVTKLLDIIVGSGRTQIGVAWWRELRVTTGCRWRHSGHGQIDGLQ